MKFIIYFGIIFGYIKFSESIDCSVKDHKNTELRLKHNLLCDYDAEERPTSKNGTLVKIRLFIKKFDFYEHSGELVVISWLGMIWEDSRLKWNRNDYDNIDEIVIAGKSIWIPDLAIYNSDTTQFHETCTTSECHVTNKGMVTCMPPCRHKADCDSNFANWPYDDQSCKLHLGSWLHKGSELRFKEVRTLIDYEDVTHNEWKITNISYRNNVGVYQCCPNDTFPSVTYYINIQRHSNTEQTLVIPPAIILCFINLVILWLNPTSPERIILIAVSIFFHFHYLKSVSREIPNNGSTVPVVLIFFRDSLIISSFILFETLMMRCLLMCQKSSPEWIKSTAQKIRSHRMGQLMFENPYIINRTPLNNDSNPIDSANLAENGQNDNINKSTEKEVWFSTVKIIDTILFLILFICYLVMICGWLPNSKNKSLISDKNNEIHRQ